MATEIERLLVRIEATQAKYEKQLRSMARTSVKEAKKSERAWVAANNNIAKSDKRAIQGFTGANRSRRFVIQNTANQLQDIAVQLAAGTSAARTLGQQIPQLLGGFGPLGAVLGTVAAIGFPVAGALGIIGSAAEQAARGAKESDEAIAELGKATREFASAADDANVPFEELVKKFGTGAVEAREFLNVMKELRQRGAILAAADPSTLGQFGDIDISDVLKFVDAQREMLKLQEGLDSGRVTATETGRFAQLRDQLTALTTVDEAVRKLADGLQITEIKALDVAQALAEFQNAQAELGEARGAEAQVEALERAKATAIALRTEFIRAAGRIDNMTLSQQAFTNRITETINSTSATLDKIREIPGALEQSSQAAAALTAELNAAANAAAGIITSLNRSIQRQKVLLATVGDTIGRERELAVLKASQAQAQVNIQDRIVGVAFQQQRDEIRRQGDILGTLKKKTQEEEKRWRIANRPAKKTRGGSGGRARSGSRSGLTGAIDFSQAFGGITAQVEQQTAAINAALGAMDAMGISLDQNAVAAEKARIQFQLLAAAQRDGIAITPELKERIDQLSTAYATATVAAKQLGQANTQVSQSAQEYANIAKTALKGFISDIRNGISATEALATALGRVGDKLLDMALNTLFTPSGGGIGILGSLFGGFKGGGQVGYAQGGLLDGRGTGRSDSNVGVGPDGPIRFSRGEYIVNADATKQNLALLEAINSGRFGKLAAGGSIDAGSSDSAGPQPVKVVNAIDGPSFLNEALASRAGEQTLLNHVRARPRAFREAVGI